MHLSRDVPRLWGPVAAAGAPPAFTSSSDSYSAVPDTNLKVPESGTIRVAIVISDKFNLMDLAGPLHTFAKVQLPPYGTMGSGHSRHSLSLRRASQVATTHHNYVDKLGRGYPKVKFMPDLAYVRSAPLLFTAGGETSGIELSLHIIELYYGHDVAVRTARSVEYRGPRWQG